MFHTLLSENHHDPKHKTSFLKLEGFQKKRPKFVSTIYPEGGVVWKMTYQKKHTRQAAIGAWPGRSGSRV